MRGTKYGDGAREVSLKVIVDLLSERPETMEQLVRVLASVPARLEGKGVPVEYKLLGLDEVAGTVAGSSQAWRCCIIGRVCNRSTRC
jgi:hypothetical protein